MAEAEMSPAESAALSEFQEWFEAHASDSELMFLQENRRLKDGAIRMDIAFTDDSNFVLVCPFEYPHGKNMLFDIRTENDRLTKDWLPKIREYATKNRGQVKLPGILSKCLELHRDRGSHASTSAPISIPSPQDSDFEDDPGYMPVGSAPMSSDGETEDFVTGDDNFTTEWDIQMDCLRKRWFQKEKEMRSKLDPDAEGTSAAASLAVTPKPPTSQEDNLDVNGPDPKKTKFEDKSTVPKAGQQIFEHESAAFQILSNEMVSLLKIAKSESLGGSQCQFSCSAIDDSLYQWRVHIGAFPTDHPLYGELDRLKFKFGYDTIELQLDFVPDFPFYPPLLRLVRPRLKGSLVQSLANIDILKLTFWNPAKNVHDVLKQIKEILLQHARLDVENERNDEKKYPEGAYLPLEDCLIKLALAAEARPRANFDVITVENLEKAPQLRTKVTTVKETGKASGGWRAGVGYGSGSRTTGWNPETYLAAQQEKDKQILEILKQIKKEIDCVNPKLEDQKGSEVYSIIEGSCLLPFLEQQLAIGSFIEIGRHLELYQLILDVIEALSKTPNLLPLLCNVPRQKLCIMAYIEQLQEAAAQCVELTKDADRKPNGKGKTKAAKAQAAAEVPEKRLKDDQELANAAKIVGLFTKLKKTLADAGLKYSREEQLIETQKDESLVDRYVRLLKPLQYGSIDMSLTGQWAHKYAKNVEDKLSSEARSIWKECTSLKTNLPINLKSTIFVRCDESHLNLLQAMIIGPEDTPYANGCFFFDICFPVSYPSKPPLVNLRTTGSGRVRFNPNLYNCGKVCLSLLGTWSGESGENWNKTSTLLQVLVSIQSLILVDEPYFNEPGYERTMGTEDGKKNSEKYNKEVRTNCLRYAMIEQLQQPQPGFEDVVRLHYQVKKEPISKQVDDWLKLDAENKGLKADVEKMKKLLNDLPKLK